MWDIKFLLDRQTVPDFKLVQKKLTDYGWTADAFKSKMSEKIELLAQPDTANHFYAEMSRFVDATVLPQLKNPSMANMFLRKSIELGQQTIAANLG